MAKAYLVTIVPAALCSRTLRPNTSSDTSSPEAFFISNGVGSRHVMRTSCIDSEPTRAAAGANRAAAGAREAAAARVGSAAPTCDFALALEWRGSGTAVLVLAGELDLYRAP